MRSNIQRKQCIMPFKYITCIWPEDDTRGSKYVALLNTKT